LLLTRLLVIQIIESDSGQYISLSIIDTEMINFLNF